MIKITGSVYQNKSFSRYHFTIEGNPVENILRKIKNESQLDENRNFLRNF